MLERFIPDYMHATGYTAGFSHLKGANSMAMSGPISRNDVVGTGRAISVLFGVNGDRNK